MTAIIQQIKERFSQSLVKSFGENFADTDPLIVAASNPRFGDYQCNISLSLAKELKQKPREVAATLLKNLEIDDLCQPPKLPDLVLSILPLNPVI